MPPADNADNRSSIHQSYHNSHDEHNSQPYRQRPPRYTHASEATDNSEHRSSSKGPRDGGGTRPPGAPSKEPGSHSTRVQVVDKGAPSEPPLPSTDPTDGPRPSERKSPISVCSDGSYDVVEKKQAMPSKRDNVTRSSTKDEATSSSRDTKAAAAAGGSERSYARVLTQDGASEKSSGNSGPKAPLVNSEPKPSRSDSPTKHTSPTPHLPKGPTDARFAPSASASAASGQNSYPPSAPSIPLQKLVVSEEVRGQSNDGTSSGSSESEILPSPQLASEAYPAGPDPPQQTRSHQHQQPPQPVQQEDSRATSRIWKTATAFLGHSGGQPRDRPADERYQAEIRIDNLQRDLNRATREYRAQRQRCIELEHENLRLRENNNALQHELINNQRELQEAKSLSDIRGKELMGAQVFLTKADSLSMSDIIEKVGILNEEIFQTAAFFAEGIRHQKHEVPLEHLQKCYEQTRSVLGEQMTRLLQSQGQLHEANSEVNPLLGQAVISSYMVHFCNSKLNSWYPSDPNISNFLAQVYGQMRQSEEQAVFGRWRSLVRAQIRPSTDGWKPELFNKFEMLFSVASWDAPNDLKRAFDAKVGPIFKAIEDLRSALYEKFTSADLEAFVVEPSGPFQSWMEDAYVDGRSAQSNLESTEIVAGTTGFGLKKYKPKGGGSHESYNCVLPPKVVLQSTVKEALEPPPPTKGRNKRQVVHEDGGHV